MLLQRIWLQWHSGQTRESLLPVALLLRYRSYLNGRLTILPPPPPLCMHYLTALVNYIVTQNVLLTQLTSKSATFTVLHRGQSYPSPSPGLPTYITSSHSLSVSCSRFGLWNTNSLHSNTSHLVLVLHSLSKSTQGCHWTYAKITENLCVRAVSQKMNTKTDRKFRKRKMK